MCCADSMEGKVKLPYESLHISIIPLSILSNTERSDSPHQPLHISNNASGRDLQYRKRGKSRLCDVFDAENVFVERF
jgi:hypothetical protein